MTRLPDFMIIGAARSGTTAVYSFLRQHPGVFMSRVKEPNYFAFEPGALSFAGPGAEFVNNSVTSFEAYGELFADAPAGARVGEASPLYLYSEHAPRRISDRLPDARLIAILRNPVEQAHSHFLYARKEMIEPLADFGAALDAQEERRAARWQPLFQYSAFPRYNIQLRRYLECFRREQMLLFLYEDLERDPSGLMRQIFRFIGVDDRFVPDVRARPNAGGDPRSRLLQSVVMRPNVASQLAGALLPPDTRRWLRDLISSRNTAKVELPRAAGERLRATMRDDIIDLQTLIQRDLSAWLRPA